MQPKPIFIGMAAGILIFVVAAASFAAGLYLGQRGYVAALQAQPQNAAGQPFVGGQPSAGNPLPPGPAAGQPLQNGSAPAGGPPGAPYWPPDGIGRLVSLTRDSITLDMPPRQVTIPINASTKFTDDMGREIAQGDLKPGDVIAVFGRDVAALLMRLPSPPNAP